MNTTKVITKTHENNIVDWYEDYEININSINGYSTIYRRLVYERGYVKRVVIGFTPYERDLAYNSLYVLDELKGIKESFWYRVFKFLFYSFFAGKSKLKNICTSKNLFVILSKN
jgi:hypothetical protein